MTKKGLSVDKALNSGSPKKRETWSQTKRVGDTTEEMRVEKLDNTGYLVTISKTWYDEKRNWKEKEVKLYSEINPLDTDENDNPIDAIYSYLKGGVK